MGIREAKLQLRGTGSWNFQDWVPKLELGNQYNHISLNRPPFQLIPTMLMLLKSFKEFALQFRV
jgi:hypothetical protein